MGNVTGPLAVLSLSIGGNAYRRVRGSRYQTRGVGAVDRLQLLLCVVWWELATKTNLVMSVLRPNLYGNCDDLQEKLPKPSGLSKLN